MNMDQALNVTLCAFLCEPWSLRWHSWSPAISALSWTFLRLCDAPVPFTFSTLGILGISHLSQTPLTLSSGLLPPSPVLPLQNQHCQCFLAAFPVLCRNLHFLSWHYPGFFPGIFLISFQEFPHCFLGMYQHWFLAILKQFQNQFLFFLGISAPFFFSSWMFCSAFWEYIINFLWIFRSFCKFFQIFFLGSSMLLSGKFSGCFAGTFS